MDLTSTDSCLGTYSNAILKRLGANLSPCFKPLPTLKPPVIISPFLTWYVESFIGAFIKLIPFCLGHDLSGMGGSTSSYATTGIALKTLWTCKPHYINVGIPSEGSYVTTAMFVWFRIMCMVTFLFIPQFHWGGEKKKALNVQNVQCPLSCEMKCQTWTKKFCSTACGLCVETKYLVLYCLFQTINSISLRKIPIKESPGFMSGDKGSMNKK